MLNQYHLANIITQLKYKKMGKVGALEDNPELIQYQVGLSEAFDDSIELLEEMYRKYFSEE